MSDWTEPAGIRSQVRKKWVNGSLLKRYTAGLPFEPISVLIKGPTAHEVAQNLTKVRRWVTALERASLNGDAFRLETKRVGGSGVGYTTLPARISFDTYAQVWRLLDVQSEITLIDDLLQISAQRADVVRWIQKYPLKAIAHATVWRQMLDAYDWLEWNRATGKYVREIDVPGVDTKFVETHRDTLAGMLGVSSSLQGFVRDLGLADKPATVRMRMDPLIFGFPPALTEVNLRVDEVATLEVSPRVVLIIENEVTYLSVPVPVGAVVIWGKGYDVAHLGSLPWLTDTRVLYWGDIDTHGMQILHRARSYLPHTESVLMDTATLLASRDNWGSEPKPTRDNLVNLTHAEATLYSDLVSDRFGVRVRLEQERIRWDLVMSTLRAAKFFGAE